MSKKIIAVAFVMIALCSCSSTSDNRNSIEQYGISTTTTTETTTITTLPELKDDEINAALKVADDYCKTINAYSYFDGNTYIKDCYITGNYEYDCFNGYNYFDFEACVIDSTNISYKAVVEVEGRWGEYKATNSEILYRCMNLEPYNSNVDN